ASVATPRPAANIARPERHPRGSPPHPPPAKDVGPPGGHHDLAQDVPAARAVDLATFLWMGSTRGTPTSVATKIGKNAPSQMRNTYRGKPESSTMVSGIQAMGGMKRNGSSAARVPA